MDNFCCFNSVSQVGGRSSCSSGKGRSHQSPVKYGFSLVKGKANHPMEDYHVSKFVHFQGRELGLFAIYDGHLGDSVPAYLQKHLFPNILKDEEFWTDTNRSISKAYERTDQAILSHNPDLGRGGSTAVTAILIDGQKLWIANVGDSRAVLSKRGKAIQMTIDHEPNTERGSIENRGGFVSNMPGDVARVNGQLAVSRAFGDKNLKLHLRSDPDVQNAIVGPDTDLLILASDGLWKVVANQDAVDIAKRTKDPQKAAKQLVAEALKRESKDDISCIVVRFKGFDLKDHVTGFGNRDWERAHKPAGKTAVAVTAMLKNGAACVGKTVMDELAFGITGENMHYGTPTNPQMPSCIPGGSSSGSAVAVAVEIVDFALGTDTIGGVRIPASFCGIIGYRPSHGAVSTIGVIPNSQSLDTVGWFARDPSVLHRVGHALLQLNSVEPRRARRLIFADDLFQFSKVPTQKTLYVVSKAIENLSGYQLPKHMNFGQYIVSNVPSLKGFREPSTNLQNGTSTLKALSSVMISLQRYEFKTNHEEWVKSVKPKLGPDVSDRVLAAINTSHENMKILYRVRTEMRAALQNLLKEDGILVIPTVADSPLKLNTKRGLSAEFHDRAFALSSIASMSGCCQVTIPIGKHNDCPISVSFITFHGADKFLLDTVLDIYPSLQAQACIASNSVPLPDTNGNMDASELLKEKGNAAFKGRQWNKAVNYYTEAIKLNETNATFYCNRAAAYLELGCFQQAEEDCSKAILHDKKNVKAYLRRGTARESLLRYKEAAKDFKHALVLEPQNKVASLAEKRLRKLMS